MLNTPPLLLGAALLLWGWQSGLLVFAAVMALLVELSHWVRFRFDFSRSDMCRVWDLCSVLTVAAGFYCVMTNDSINEVMVFFQNVNLNPRPLVSLQLAGAAKVFFQWWPLLLYLMIVAQAYGPNDRLPLTVYSLIHRRRMRREGREPEAGSGANFGFPYLAVCLYSASLSMRHQSQFFWCFAAICVWGLYAVRPRRFTVLSWGLVVTLLVTGGFVTQREFPRAAAALEGKFVGMFWQWLRKRQADNDFDTSIGDVSGLKGDGRIVMRLEARATPPALLPEAVYCRFDGERWDNPMWMSFEEVPPELDGETWVLGEAPEAEGTLLIAREFGRRLRGVARPRSTVLLDQMPVEKFTTNALGSIRAGRGVPFIVYRAAYGATNPVEMPPILPIDVRFTSPDMTLPEFEDDALEKVAAEIGVTWGQDTEEIVAAVSRFFASKFEYSLDDPPNQRLAGETGQTLIGRFLLDARRGHCEYFATATALLLRHLGIPTRYVLGWTVQEQGVKEGVYIVRSRHAHSWVRYWSDQEGRWRVLDTTPHAGLETDLAQASWLEPLEDWWSDRMHGFRMWRYYGEGGAWQSYVLGMLLILLVFSAWRVFGRRRRRVAENEVAGFYEFARLGLDSDFHEINQRIQRSGVRRRDGETLLDWLQRLEARADLHPDLLREMVGIHYRYRFDPSGIGVEDRKRLRETANRWRERADGKVRAE